jgi:ElaB/YqjD/DUF883 family membrane-anchored ribosome-binding protein
MERNPNDNINSQSFDAGAGSGSTGSGSFGAGASSSPASTSGSTGGYGEGGFGNSTADTLSGDLKDKAAELKDTAKGKAEKFREKASDLKATLADKLEAGAEKLRSQQPGAYAGATGTSTTAIPQDKLAQVNDKLAAGMQSTADFIRNADLDNMKQGVEKQVKENPGRSLLIAAGLGYLLGRAFRK